MNIEKMMNRRMLMRQAGNGLAASVLATMLPTAVTANAASSKDRATEFKQQLRDPILSIPTPFTADLAVDYRGVRRMISSGRSRTAYGSFRSRAATASMLRSRIRKFRSSRA
jgi:hypothetical protein